VGGFRLAHYHLGVTNVSDKSEANIATADVLTLLLHNQHAIVFAIDQFTQWRSENGVGDASDNGIRPAKSSFPLCKAKAWYALKNANFLLKWTRVHAQKTMTLQPVFIPLPLQAIGNRPANTPFASGM
jgi:hypothetical protein